MLKRYRMIYFSKEDSLHGPMEEEIPDGAMINPAFVSIEELEIYVYQIKETIEVYKGKEYTCDTGIINIETIVGSDMVVDLMDLKVEMERKLLEFVADMRDEYDSMHRRLEDRFFGE